MANNFLQEDFRIQLPENLLAHAVHPNLPLLAIVRKEGIELYYFYNKVNFLKLGQFSYIFDNPYAYATIKFHNTLPLMYCYWGRSNAWPPFYNMHVFKYNYLPSRSEITSYSGMTSLLLDKLYANQDARYRYKSDTSDRVGNPVLLTPYQPVFPQISIQKRNLPLYTSNRTINQKKQNNIFKSILNINTIPLIDFTDIEFHPTYPMWAIYFNKKILFYRYTAGILQPPPYEFNIEDPARSILLPNPKYINNWVIKKITFHHSFNYIAINFSSHHNNYVPEELYIFQFDINNNFNLVAKTQGIYSYVFHTHEPLLLVFYGKQENPNIFNLQTISDIQLHPTVKVSSSEINRYQPSEQPKWQQILISHSKIPLFVTNLNIPVKGFQLWKFIQDDEHANRDMENRTNSTIVRVGYVSSEEFLGDLSNRYSFNVTINNNSLVVKNTDNQLIFYKM